ncbi:MAG: 5-oxoprolinase (ATP-hydrolyzing) subunit, partial [Pseudonocardiales bacterium]|nr:5-oxoprolinase (ATP-hydrolyzing) subunit [Pseudonocardiales bacterium]
ALLSTSAEVVERAVRLATAGEIVAVDGTVLKVGARSLCLHGDTQGAVEMARAVRAELLALDVTVCPFVEI